jgi:hypothetical protein
MLFIFVCVGICIIGGCSCSDSKKAVDDTVDDFIGKTALDQYKKTKDQINQISEKRDKQIEELEEKGE